MVEKLNIFTSCCFSYNKYIVKLLVIHTSYNYCTQTNYLKSSTFCYNVSCFYLILTNQQAALKARDRLSTIQAKDVRLKQQQLQNKKKRKISLKRRPTFYRTTASEDKANAPNAPNAIEVDIGVDVVTTTTLTTAESDRSGSMSSKVIEDTFVNSFI